MLLDRGQGLFYPYECCFKAFGDEDRPRVTALLKVENGQWPSQHISLNLTLHMMAAYRLVVMRPSKTWVLGRKT